MKIIRILMTSLFAVFLTAATIFAQDVAPVELSDPLSDPLIDPVGNYNPDGGGYHNPGGGYYNPGGGYYNPGGGEYKPGGDAGHPYGVPEPSTLALLGIGLAAGFGYKSLKKKRD